MFQNYQGVVFHLKIPRFRPQFFYRLQNIRDYIDQWFANRTTLSFIPIIPCSEQGENSKKLKKIISIRRENGYVGKTSSRNS